MVFVIYINYIILYVPMYHTFFDDEYFISCRVHFLSQIVCSHLFTSLYLLLSPKQFIILVEKVTIFRLLYYYFSCSISKLLITFLKRRQVWSLNKILKHFK